LFTLPAAREGKIERLAFRPNGTQLATVNGDGTVKLWEVPTGRELLSVPGHGRVFAFSPNGSILATKGKRGSVSLWDTKTGKEIRTLRGHTSDADFLAFSPDGGQLLSHALFGNTLKLWRLTPGEDRSVLHAYAGAVTDLAFSADSRRLIATDAEQNLKAWDEATREEVPVRPEDVELVNRKGCVSRDGQRQAAWGPKKDHLIITDTKTNALLYALAPGLLDGVAISPDNQRVAVACADETVRLWYVPSLLKQDGDAWKKYQQGNITWCLADPSNPKETLLGHTGPVRCVAFSPDGQRLFSAGSDGTVRIWEPTTGAEILTIKGNATAIHSLALTTDGRRLAAGREDGTITFWDGR
jgi:WD40 repeat protein